MATTDTSVSLRREWNPRTDDNAGEITLTPFDRRHYLKLIQARGETIRRAVAELKPALHLANVLDAGCGVGFFSQVLEACGLYVRGFDARLENVVEARKRFPRIPFAQGGVQDPEIVSTGRFDLVLGFGLLYYLEQPAAASGGSARLRDTRGGSPAR